MSSEKGLIDTFMTFGDLLKYLRIRAHLTQRDLSIVVGYSEAQISRQESNKRVPGDYALKALYVPALGLENETEIADRLLKLAKNAREADRPRENNHLITGSAGEKNSLQTPPPQIARHNLPRQLTSFIGREKEIEQIVRMVREHPLVTLTGAGGVGKTRLALHVAKELIADFSDGVWLVELAPVIDPVFVPITVASIFNVHSAIGQRLVQTLCEQLASKCLLLIWDNCEHVIDAVAELSTSLLARCPNLSILATSREILNVEGEFFFRCPALSLPASSPARPLALVLKRAEASEAVRLFVDRAAAASPGFCLTEMNAAAISHICQRLDGIPLAIELAAARLRLLRLDQVVSYMDDLFGLIAGNRRTVLPRHQTLNALIDWSYQMLSPAEQILLRRLSIFAGGWSLAAAQAIACGDGLEPRAVIDRMGQLVDKSLIFMDTPELGENRYYMLETVRQYASDRLIAVGEGQMVRDRHLAFFSALVEQASPIDSHQFAGVPELQQLLKELDNIRVALKWAHETNIESGLRLGISFGEAVPLTLSLEMLTWLERLLAAEAGEESRCGNDPGKPERVFIRGRALLSIGRSRMFWGLQGEAAQALLESKALFESIGEPAIFFAAVAQMHLGTLMLSSAPEQSRKNLETSRKTFSRMNEKTYLSECDRVLAALYLYMGNLDQARQLIEESLRYSREINKNEIAEIEYLGHVEFLKGNYDRAIEFYQQMLEWSDKFEDVVWTAYTLSQECWVVWAQGNHERLLRLCEDETRQGQETGCTNFFLSAEIFHALMEWGQGAYDQAAQRAQEAFSLYQAEYVSFTVPLVYILGRAALSKQEYLRAEQYFRQVDAMSDGPRWRWRAYSLHGFALVAAAQSSNRPDMAKRAARLFGAQEKLFAWLPNLLSPVERDEYASALKMVKERLGEDAFLAAWACGQAMPHNDAFALALTGESEGLSDCPQQYRKCSVEGELAQ